MILTLAIALSLLLTHRAFRQLTMEVTRMSERSETNVEVDRVVINPVKCAAQIAIIHRRLMDAMTRQGPSEIAAALDNMEGAIQKARDGLGL